MTQPQTELKACPNECDTDRVKPVVYVTRWAIVCHSCGMSGPTADTASLAATRWNNLPRSSPQVAPGLRDAIYEAIVAFRVKNKGLFIPYENEIADIAANIAAAQGGQVVDRDDETCKDAIGLNVRDERERCWWIVRNHPSRVNAHVQSVLKDIMAKIDSNTNDCTYGVREVTSANSAVPSAPGGESVREAWSRIANIAATSRCNYLDLLTVQQHIEALGQPQGSDSQPDGCELIRLERQRQVSKEGYTDEHDDYHRGGEIAVAAACYAVAGSTKRVVDSRGADAFPWEKRSDKREKHDRLKRLIIAGALLAAEIDRVQKVEPAQPVGAGEAKERGDNE